MQGTKGEDNNSLTGRKSGVRNNGEETTRTTFVTIVSFKKTG